MNQQAPAPRAPFLAESAGENAVEARSLFKFYQGNGAAALKPALQGIDLDIPRGSIFGLLGPNGAGKSTFINILAGLVIKSQGDVRVWGFDIDRSPREARASIGIVPQELNIDPFFTPAALLDLQAGMYGVPKRERRTAEILDKLGLTDKADAYTRTLSGGMRRRLLVAKAMVHSPPILVLDEPTAGVDVELRQQLWDYVRTLNASGTTIILTTHYLEEAEAMCDRIAIINHGKLIACEPTPRLLARISDKRLVVKLHPSGSVTDELLRILGAEMLPDGNLTFQYNPAETPVMTLIERIKAAGLAIADLTTEESDLEDVFLQLTRRD